MKMVKINANTGVITEYDDEEQAIANGYTPNWRISDEYFWKVGDDIEYH